MRRVRSAFVAWCRRRLAAPDVTADIAAARRLIAAIDRGGIPLNPLRVNAIARDLGLEVSRRAPVDQTIERIRGYLRRVG